MGHYDTGQVCLNGHQITGDYYPGSEFASDFCAKCGAKTITKCEECGTSIRGYYDHEGSGVIAIPKFDIPSYCYACGKPFPWTANSIQAARDLTDEIEDISEDERRKVKESFVDLIADTPQTNVAVARVKKLLAKAGPVIGSSLREVLVSLATDAAKKALGL